MCWSFPPPPPATGLKCCSIKTLAASDHNLFGCNKTIISGVLTAYELAATYGPGIIIVHCWPAHIKQIKRTQREETPFLYCVRETIAESARTHRRSEREQRPCEINNCGDKRALLWWIISILASQYLADYATTRDFSSSLFSEKERVSHSQPILPAQSAARVILNGVKRQLDLHLSRSNR